MNFIPKLIFFIYLTNITALPLNDSDKPIIEENNYLITQLKRALLKEMERYFKIYHHGHNLENLDQIKINDNKLKVHNLLGSPLVFNKNPKVEYYVHQTIKKALFIFEFGKAEMIRIEYNNNKVVKITKINLKPILTCIPIKIIKQRLNESIEKLNIEI